MHLIYQGLDSQEIIGFPNVDNFILDRKQIRDIFKKVLCCTSLRKGHRTPPYVVYDQYYGMMIDISISTQAYFLKQYTLEMVMLMISFKEEIKRINPDTQTLLNLSFAIPTHMDSWTAFRQKVFDELTLLGDQPTQEFNFGFTYKIREPGPGEVINH
jgi:hypothetical protein